MKKFGIHDYNVLRKKKKRKTKPKKIRSSEISWQHSACIYDVSFWLIMNDSFKLLLNRECATYKIHDVGWCLC